MIALKRHGFAHDAFTDAGTKSAAAGHIHFDPEECFQVEHQPGMIEQAGTGQKIDEKIDVARSGVITPCRRTKRRTLAARWRAAQARISSRRDCASSRRLILS